jgi:autotransporter-associated beta strand protein
MEPTLGGTAYGIMPTTGGGGYLKLTGDAIAVAGGTFTMTGAFGTQGRNQFFKIESPVADQTLAMTGNNNFGYGGLLIDGSGTGTFTISGGNIQSESNTQSNISYFAQFSSLDVNVTSNIDNTNTGGIAKFGDGRLILSNANTYVGTSRLTDGILQVNATDTPGASGPLGASSAVGSIQFSGGILQYGSGFTKDYSSRFSVTDTSPFKIDTNGNDVTYATAIGGGTASTLTKLGDGALNLTNANTYTGLTTVSGGTLVARNAANTSPVLAGPISVTSGGTLNVIDNLMGGLPTVTGAINVADGGTLGGDAIIAGSTTIDGNHAPGLSLSAGIQTFSNGLAYLAASNLKWRLNDDVSAATTGVRGISFDGVDVTGGNFSITSGATIDLSFGGSVDFLESFWDTDQSWIVVDLSGTASGTGGTDVFTVGAFTGATPAGGSFSVSRVSDDVVLNWVASAGGASFATWAAAFSSPALADQAADADPDFDGLDNALEYVIGSDPRVSNQGGPSGGVVGTNLVMNLTRVDSSETADVGLEVQVSNDLQDWTTIAGYTIGSDTATSTSGVVVSENAAADDTITVTIPKGTAPSKFARLRVVITP